MIKPEDLRICDHHIICYDSETQRSARREATAAKHGLKVVEADE